MSRLIRKPEDLPVCRIEVCRGVRSAIVVAAQVITLRDAHFYLSSVSDRRFVVASDIGAQQMHNTDNGDLSWLLPENRALDVVLRSSNY